MRDRQVLLVAVIVALISMEFCAKAPLQDIENAKQALERVKEAEGTYYAKDELKKLESNLAAAQNEISSQHKKLLKNYTKAKGLLTALGTDCEGLIVTIEQRRRAFASLFKKTIAEVYVQGLVSSMICAVLSDYWHTATESQYLDIDTAISRGKKSIDKVGLYKQISRGKDSIDEDMKKIKDPPENFKKAYDLLLDMYGYHIQLYSQAISPTGSYISFNQSVNANYSEFEKAFQKIIVVMPEVKEEVETQKKKLDVKSL